MISVDGHQFSQLCLNTSSKRGPSTRDWAQISDDRDGSVLILQLSFPRISHSDHGIPHAMVAVNYIDDNLLDSALGYKVARVLGSSLARSGAEDLGADTPGDLQSTEGLELNYRTPSHFRQLRRGDSVKKLERCKRTSSSIASTSSLEPEDVYKPYHWAGA